MTRLVLIGPMCSGKSTIAERLSDRLSLRNIPLDLVRWGYYYQIGYDRREEWRRVEAMGWRARFDYWKPFEAYAVEQVLLDYPDTIIDFGAGHSVYEDDVLLARVQTAVKRASYVVYLLPSPDIERSLDILCARAKVPEDERANFVALNRPFLEHPSNASLATATFYTDGYSVDETCEQIAHILDSQAPPVS